jgi:hypothetical protein
VAPCCSAAQLHVPACSACGGWLLLQGWQKLLHVDGAAPLNNRCLRQCWTGDLSVSFLSLCPVPLQGVTASCQQPAEHPWCEAPVRHRWWLQAGQGHTGWQAQGVCCCCLCLRLLLVVVLFPTLHRLSLRLLQPHIGTLSRFLLKAELLCWIGHQQRLTVLLSILSLAHTPTQEEQPTSIAIAPGGLAEARFGRSNKVLLSKRFGFVKLAVEAGAQLVPVLGVGEELVAGAYATTLAAALLLPTKRVPVNVSLGRTAACVVLITSRRYRLFAVHVAACSLEPVQAGSSNRACIRQQSQGSPPPTACCALTDLGLPRTNMCCCRWCLASP